MALSPARWWHYGKQAGSQTEISVHSLTSHLCSHGARAHGVEWPGLVQQLCFLSPSHLFF